MATLNPQYKNIFARENADGNYDILHNEMGEPVDRIDEPTVYPIDSELSCCYEHPGGIVLTYDQVVELGINIE
jgi:hypothetical protein